MTAWQIFLSNLLVDTHEKRYYCKYCGATILDTRPVGGRVRQYCTKECSDAAAIERKRAMRMVRDDNPVGYEAPKVL